MATNIIEARVRQKTDTFANWMANPLILLGGEIALVITDTGAIINWRVGDGTKRFSDLPDYIKYDQSAFVRVTDTVKPVGAYTVVGEGTYSGTVIPEGMLAVLYWNGTTWLVNSQVELPKVATVDNLFATVKGNALDATQGKVLADILEATKIIVDQSSDILSECISATPVSFDIYDFTGKITQGGYSDGNGVPTDSNTAIRMTDKILGNEMKVKSTVLSLIVTWYSSGGEFVARTQHNASSSEVTLSNSSANNFSIHFFKTNLANIVPSEFTGVTLQTPNYTVKALPRNSINVDGGVAGFEFAKSIDGRLDGIITTYFNDIEEFSKVENKYVDRISHAIVSDTNSVLWDYYTKNVLAGEKYKFKLGLNLQGVMLFKSSWIVSQSPLDFISMLTTPPSSAGVYEYEVTIPEDGVLVVNNRKISLDVPQLLIFETRQSDNEKYVKVGEINDFIETTSIIDPNSQLPVNSTAVESKFNGIGYNDNLSDYSILQGGYIDAINNEVNYSSSTTWDVYYAKFKTGDKLKIKVGGRINYAITLFEDEWFDNQESEFFIQRLSGVPSTVIGGEVKEYEVTVPQDGVIAINSRKLTLAIPEAYIFSENTEERYVQVKDLNSFNLERNASLAIQKGVIISDTSKFKGAHSSIIYANPKSKTLYYPYLGNQISWGENPNYMELVLGQLESYDTSSTEEFPILNKGQVFADGFVQKMTWYAPEPWIVFDNDNDNLMKLLFHASNENDSLGSRMVYRIWNKSTKSYTENNLHSTTLSYNGVVNNFSEGWLASIFNSMYGADNTVFTESLFQTVCSYSKWSDGYYYFPLSIYPNRPTTGVRKCYMMIIKTVDFVSFDAVAANPNLNYDNYPETMAEIIDNKLYCCVRQLDGYRVCYYDLITNSWSRSTLIPCERSGRPILINYKGDVILVVNDSDYNFIDPTTGLPVIRTGVRIAKLNTTSLQIDDIVRFTAPTGCHYFSVTRDYVGEWWFAWSEDKRLKEAMPMSSSGVRTDVGLCRFEDVIGH